jgi:hypothetical protein
VECKWLPGTCCQTFCMGPLQRSLWMSLLFIRRCSSLCSGSQDPAERGKSLLSLCNLLTVHPLYCQLPVKARSQRADKNRIISERLFFVMWWQELTFYIGYNFLTEGLQDAY